MNKGVSGKPCPFCQRDPARVLEEDDLTVIYRDGFPVSPGHILIIPKRHVATLFEASETEQQALLKALNRAQAILDESHHPDGYNIGINHGAAGGQTVFHLHIHLIPRYQGDCEDPVIDRHKGASHDRHIGASGSGVFGHLGGGQEWVFIDVFSTRFFATSGAFFGAR